MTNVSIPTLEKKPHFSKPGDNCISDRIRRLKEKNREKEPEVCLERAQIVTRVYKETEGKPAVLRRAMALKAVLKEMTIFIEPDQLIVGNHAAKPKTTPIFPEYSIDWLELELEEIEKRKDYAVYLGEEKKQELRKIFSYWRGKTVKDMARENWSEDMFISHDREFIFSSIYDSEGIGHTALGYDRVLEKGFLKIKNEAEKRKKELDKSDSSYKESRDFLTAVCISCDAAVNFAKRFSREAVRMAEKETDLKRKDELERIAEICDRIPAHPAESFYEAVQSFWFVHLITQIESNGHGISLGRFDQYMYPYYKKDIESGKITPDDAVEILECLWIKLTEFQKLRELYRTEARAGHSLFQNLTIGGQTPDGNDATNELSFLILDVVKRVKLTQPTVSLRWFPGLNKRLLLKACEVIRDAHIGMPALFCDNPVIHRLKERKIPIETARDYAFMGCVEPVIPGMTSLGSDAGYINLAKCVELALFNGENPLTNRLAGPQTGDVTKFRTFEDVLEAYSLQVRYFLGKLLQVHRDEDKAQIDLAPLPFFSSFTDDCISRARDVKDRGARYRFSRVFGLGLPDTIDMLFTIKKAVFEDKFISMEELLNTLRTNFEGKEAIRQYLLNKYPKYGNDYEEVDLFARQLCNMYLDVVRQFKTFYGDEYVGSFIVLAKNVFYGKHVGATPDGRLSGQPLADGGVSPVYGRDKNGPTAVIRSVANIEHYRAEGTLLNMKFTGDILAGDEGLQNLNALVRTYFDMGGYHIQFNVIDKQTLIAAQKSPEEYRDLIVRVAGFSAFFTELAKDVQDNIIERTEHRFN